MKTCIQQLLLAISFCQHCVLSCKMYVSSWNILQFWGGGWKNQDAFGSEPSPESFHFGGFEFLREALHSKKWQKQLDYSVSIFGGDPPSGDGTASVRDWRKCKTKGGNHPVLQVWETFKATDQMNFGIVKIGINALFTAHFKRIQVSARKSRSNFRKYLLQPAYGCLTLRWRTIHAVPSSPLTSDN